MKRVTEFDAAMSVEHGATETVFPEPFVVHVTNGGTPIVEFADGNAVEFSAEDLVNDALWFIELDDCEDE